MSNHSFISSAHDFNVNNNMHSGRINFSSYEPPMSRMSSAATAGSSREMQPQNTTIGNYLNSHGWM